MRGCRNFSSELHTVGSIRLTLFLVILFFIAVPQAGMDTESFAGIGGASGITITQTTQVNWGTVMLDTAQTNYAALETNTNDTYTISIGTLVSGSPTQGLYTIKNTNVAGTLCIDLLNLNSGNAALSVSKIEFQYDGGATFGVSALPKCGLADPGTTGKIFEVGAKLTASSSVTEGTYVPSFDIKAY